MKQKMVIKVSSMNGSKSRSKAMKIAVSLSGVESASLGGQDKSQIEVIGDGVDAVELTTLLRKNVGHAELLSVSAVGEKKDGKDEKKPGAKVENVPMPPIVWTYGNAMPHYVYVKDQYLWQRLNTLLILKTNLTPNILKLQNCSS